MFDFIIDKQICPACNSKIGPANVKISQYRKIKVYNCPKCKADFIKNKRSELFRILEEGAVLC